MKKHILFISCLVLLGVSPHSSAAQAPSDVDAKAAYARLSTLVGDWEAETAAGKARLTYELIAGGTALAERETIGNMPPMQTVYHLDRNRLLLTHYCAAGNQPRMQAKVFNQEKGEVQFEFLDATNLASESEGHMRNARLRLIDKDHLVSEWEFYENGLKTTTESFNFVRIR